VDSKILHNDKGGWCDFGGRAEKYFIDNIASQYGLDIVMHPDKEFDVYSTDMYSNDWGMDVDLKYRAKPFFKAHRYGYDPNHTITINHKDYVRYMTKYPEWDYSDMVILIWVNWKPEKKYGISVKGKGGLWALRLSTLDSYIRSGRLRSHSYINRQDGYTGTSSKHSWLVDLRNCYKINKKEVS